jgi:hypothetical protein
LFSEFVFDLPNDLPPALSNDLCAEKEARLLVEDLCDRLRNDHRTHASYIERAEGIEKELNLPHICEKNFRFWHTRIPSRSKGALVSARQWMR